MAWWKWLTAKTAVAAQLSASDWLALAEAWWAMLFFSLLSRRAGFERLQALACPPIKSKLHTSSNKPFEPERLAWLTEIAARRHILSITCLARALALCWMLRRRAWPAQICLGVDKTAAEFQAHAWVEIGGQPLGERDDLAHRFERFRPANRA